MQQISILAYNILQWFLKDHVTLKTGVMMLKNSALHHRNKLHFKVYKIENFVITTKIVILYFTLLQFLLYCRLYMNKNKTLKERQTQYNSALNKQNKMLHVISSVSILSKNLFQAALLSMFNEAGPLERYSMRNEEKPDQYCRKETPDWTEDLLSQDWIQPANDFIYPEGMIKHY